MRIFNNDDHTYVPYDSLFFRTFPPEILRRKGFLQKASHTYTPRVTTSRIRCHICLDHLPLPKKDSFT